MKTQDKCIYGVWITNRDGDPNGRWMSDRDNGKDVWSGEEWEAINACNVRKHMYRHVNYEVREIIQ